MAVVAGPSPAVLTVIGRLETLAVTERDGERRRVLEACVADLQKLVDVDRE